MTAIRKIGIGGGVLAVSFLAGWTISSGTGVEPGFFEAPEAAGYGVSAKAAVPEGISSEMQEYYDKLSSE